MALFGLSQNVDSRPSPRKATALPVVSNVRPWYGQVTVPAKWHFPIAREELRCEHQLDRAAARPSFPRNSTRSSPSTVRRTGFRRGTLASATTGYQYSRRPWRGMRSRSPSRTRLSAGGSATGTSAGVLRVSETVIDVSHHLRALAAIRDILRERGSADRSQPAAPPLDGRRGGVEPAPHDPHRRARVRPARHAGRAGQDARREHHAGAGGAAPAGGRGADLRRRQP